MSKHQILNLPKHRNPDPDRTASAPYNFVPLPEVVVTAVDDPSDLPDHDRYYPDRHTGYFDVTLTAKSPLYVRCPFTLDDFLRQERGEDVELPFRKKVRNTPNFFYTCDPNRPVIPGSSLRGMLRSVLEIASYGKMQWVMDKRLVYRAVGDPSSLGNHYREQMLGLNKINNNKDKNTNMRFDYPSPRLKGGYLRRTDTGWAIQPACEINGETFVHVEYEHAQPIIGGRGRQKVHDVFVQPVGRTSSYRGERGQGGTLTLDVAVTPRISASFDSGLVPAKLVESGHMDGKHPKHWHCAIYEPDPAKPLIPITDEMWEIYLEDRDLTRGIPTRPLIQDGDPLFYLLDDQGNLVFFGPTMMFRLPYRQSPIDLVPPELRRPEDIDYAEALFGFVKTRRELEDMKQRKIISEIPKQGDKRRAYAGRVFVTDAVLEEGQTGYWLSDHPVTPKILATPKPTAFQHYLTQQEPNDRNQLDHYDSPPSHKTVIRGYKLYWHQGERTRRDIEDLNPPPASTQHTQLKPVKAGVRFKFRIYFENLSDRELGALCWMLHPLGNPGKEYCHHLGMGKPLGMGAVKLEATLYLANRPERYKSLFDGNNWQTGITGGGEPLSDRAKLEVRTRPFERHILETLGIHTKCHHLFEVKRIGMLLKLMEWPGYSADPKGKLFIPSQNRPNTRYMTIQPNEYRNRPVLPDPCAFDPGICNLAEPASSSSQVFSDLTTQAIVASPSSFSTTVFQNFGRELRKQEPKEVTRREWVVLIEDVKGGKAKVKTESGEIITCSGFTSYPRGTAGTRCRADVTRKGGKAETAIFKGWG